MATSRHCGRSWAWAITNERSGPRTKVRNKSADDFSPYRTGSDQVIREDPSAARGVAGAPKNRQRILSVHRSGWSWNAGPQQRY